MDPCPLMFKRVDGWAKREGGGGDKWGNVGHSRERELLPSWGGFTAMKMEGEAD